LVDDVVISGNTIMGGNLTINGDITIPNIPTTDNTLIQILGRDSVSGDIKYRNVESIISASTKYDTFLTGATLNVNTLELSRNQGLSNLTVDLSQFIDDTNYYVTGGTYNNITNTITLNRQDGNVDITGITNTFITGGTLNGDNLNITRNDGVVVSLDLNTLVSGKTNNNTFVLYTGDTLNILNTKVDNGINNGGGNELFSGLTGSDMYFRTLSGGSNTTLTTIDGVIKIDVEVPTDVNTFVTGQTFNSTTYDLTLNRSGGLPSITSNLGALASDIFVLSGVYDLTTGIVTYTTNSGTTFQVSGFTTGMTDSYTTDAYLSGTEIRFDNNIQGSNVYNVDLLPLLSGKTNNTNFWSHTGNTNNPHQTSFNNLISTGHTHALSEITDFSSYSGSVQTLINNKVSNNIFSNYTGNTLDTLNTKIDGGFNNGGGNELFSGVTGSNMYFRTLSGGSNTTLTTINDVIKIDVAVPPSSNSYVTGTTLNGNSLELGRNGGLSTLTTDLSSLSTTDKFVSGGTYTTGNIFFSGNSSDTSFIVNVSALLDNTNSYVTGGTVSGTNLVLGRNGGLSSVTTDLSSLSTTDNYVTGATMSSNTLELSRSGGLSDVTVDLSQFVDGSDNYVSGGTYSNGTLLFSGTSPNQSFSVDVSELTDNSYVTGSTLNGNVLELGRNGGLSTLTTNLSSLSTTDTFVTGVTWNNGGLLTTALNNGTDITTNINTFNNITVNGNAGLNGSVSGLTFSGTTDRLVEASTTGTLTATRNIIEGYITSSVTISGLTNSSNWTINGSYTGSTITDTFQGQNYYDDNYFFTAVGDNLWIRLIRG